MVPSFQHFHPPAKEMKVSSSEEQENTTSSMLYVLGDPPVAAIPKEEKAKRRIERSRERNREHARRTRMRKKAQLEDLQSKVETLKKEGKVLKQRWEECRVANILVGLSGNPTSSDSDDCSVQTPPPASSVPELHHLTPDTRRSPCSTLESESSSSTTQPYSLTISGKQIFFGDGRAHINWKSGLYSDECGTKCRLTRDQMDSLRRERNRMHAKHTRDRRKNFLHTLEKTVQELQLENGRMRLSLAKMESLSPYPIITLVPSGQMSPLRDSGSSVEGEF